MQELIKSTNRFTNDYAIARSGGNQTTAMDYLMGGTAIERRQKITHDIANRRDEYIRKKLIAHVYKCHTWQIEPCEIENLDDQGFLFMLGNGCSEEFYMLDDGYSPRAIINTRTQKIIDHPLEIFRIFKEHIVEEGMEEDDNLTYADFMDR